MTRGRLAWSSPCSVVLPHRTVAEVRGLVPSRGGGWLTRGLHVRLRGDRVKARINQLSQMPQSVPLLDGRLVPDPQGARIDGVLRWTVQVLSLWVCWLTAMGLAAGGVLVGFDDPVTGAVACAFSACFWCLWGWQLRSAVEERDVMEQELRNALVERFARKR